MTLMEDVYTMPEFAAPEYLQSGEYAKRHGIPPRTVKRWLANGEIPGAYRDEKGWWVVPADAPHEPNPASATAARPGPLALPGPTLDLDALPTFLTLERAADILGLKVGTLENRDNRRYFRIRKLGGRLVMPLSRIKKLRGVRG